jgi:hypothetical protein
MSSKGQPHEEGMMNGVMSRERGMIPRFLCATAVFFCLFLMASDTAKAMDPEKALPEILREAPSVNMYTGQNGVVLLRDLQYRLRSDGFMEKTTYLVLEEIRGLSKTWQAIPVVAPPGGSCEILEARLYDRRTSSPMLSVKPPRTRAEDGEALEVRIPNNLDGRILVVGFRTIHPTQMNVEDRVNLALALPVWEQKISVEVPSGLPLVSVGGEGVIPDLERNGSTDIYRWSFLDTPPRKSEGLFKEPSRVLVFSLTKGGRMAFEAAASEDPGSAMPVPEEVDRLLSEGPSVKTGKKILEYFAASRAISTTLPEDHVRPAADISAQGPWSVWEASFLLKNWMENAGWGVETLWKPAVSLQETIPATKKIWTRPVLYLVPPSGNGFYYSVQQQSPPGTVPPSLWGRTLYGLEGGTLSKRIVPTGDAGDHRLTVRWKLEMDETGAASGEFELRVRGGWLQALCGGRAPTMDNFRELLDNASFPNTPDIRWQEANIRKRSNGFDLAVTFHATSGILSGEDILIRWPVAVFPWQQDTLTEVSEDMSLRFPLVFEQKTVMKIPEGFDVLALPAMHPSERRGITLTENMEHTRRGRTIKGGYKVVVSSAGLGRDGFSDFRSVTNRTIAWTDMTIPLRKTQ